MLGMGIRVSNTDLPGIVTIVPDKFGDPRGYFSETYNRRDLAAHGITADFVQENQSLSAQRGVVRGLHFQAPPHDQLKLIRVIRGAILDVVLDIRHGSPSFGRHLALALNAENHMQLLVPAGFAHGFVTTEPDTEIIYKVTNYYAPSHDLGLAWDDPDLGIDWPVTAATAILSDRDRKLPRLRDLPAYFTYTAPT
jgi:dTDP-4-dehydrorhamnose 3,5-epimerase